MIERTLSKISFSDEFGRQMRFVAGPRQAGKTTLARQFLQQKKCVPFYYNWDEPLIRQRYRQDPQFVWTDLKSSSLRKSPSWICFDEIHKMPKWKNILKGIFDLSEPQINIIVTGSARLDSFRRSGDSLAGRYFLFHLLPLSLFELTCKRKRQHIIPLKDPTAFIEGRLEGTHYHQEKMEGLLKWSGFPEPFLKASEKFNRKWHQDYFERLVREDIRDLTLIRDLENIINLVAILPHRISNPLSLNSLREDCEVSHTAIRNYIKAMELTYILFQVAPYTKRIQRSVRKEKKVYFFDWSNVPDAGARFENYIACELLGWVMSWNDEGLGQFELRYVRTRLGKETDFLILWDGKPWLLFEVKLSRQSLERHHVQHAQILGKIPVVQLVQKSGIVRKEETHAYSISASRFLGA